MFVIRRTFDKSHIFPTIRWAQKVLNLTERRLSPAFLEPASPKGAVSNSTTICLPTTLCLASGLRQMYTCFLIRQLFPFYPVSYPGFFHWRVSIGKARSTACDPCSPAKCTWIKAGKGIPSWYGSDGFLLLLGMFGVKCSSSMNESPAIQVGKELKKVLAFTGWDLICVETISYVKQLNNLHTYVSK